MDKEHIDFWIRTGTTSLQNCDETLILKESVTQSFKTSKQKESRKCTLSIFQRRNRNGEFVKRSWLCFSPARGRLYCSACRLIGSNPSRIQLVHGGFCDWKHSGIRLSEHKTSKEHLEAVFGFARRA